MRGEVDELPSPPFLYQNPELKCWKLFQSLSSVSCSAVKDVPGSVSAVVSDSDHSSSACPASSSTSHSFPLIMMHLSLKSPSSSIIISESESGSMHNMTVFFFGLILTHLLGTIACFCSILIISCSVMRYMS